MSEKRTHLGWFKHADALLALLQPPQTANRIARAYFRENPGLGRRDREAIMDLACDLLRDAAVRQAMTPCFAENDGSLSLAYYLRNNPEQQERLLGKWRNAEAVASALAQAAEATAPAFAADLAGTRQALEFWSLPQWWAEDLVAQGIDIDAALPGLRQRATLDLRVNQSKMDRASALTELGAPFEPTPFSAWGVRAPWGTNIEQHPLYLNGSVEIQDEGSQLIAEVAHSALTSERDGDGPLHIIDACAGGGGKSLALAARFPRARIEAWDINEKRFGDLRERATRAGAAITPRVWNMEPPQSVDASADIVLADAPCSGSGTVRRSLTALMPEGDVDRLTRTQGKILDAASKWVRSGGTLVYATCSILERENEAVVRAFLKRNPQFTVESLPDALPTSSLGDGQALRLWPHLHDTDGFFAVRMRRRPTP